MSETGCLWAYDMPGNSSPAKEVTNNIKLSLIVSESIKTNLNVSKSYSVVPNSSIVRYIDEESQEFVSQKYIYFF